MVLPGLATGSGLRAREPLHPCVAVARLPLPTPGHGTARGAATARRGDCCVALLVALGARPARRRYCTRRAVEDGRTGEVSFGYVEEEEGTYDEEIRSHLQQGQLRQAVRLFLKAEREGQGTKLPLELRGAIFRVLGSSGQLAPAVAHIRRQRVERSGAEEEATEEDLVLFNMLFSGLAAKSSSDSVQLSEMLLETMAAAGVRPDGETLGMVLEVQVRAGLPGLLRLVGRTLLEFKDRHQVLPGSYSMLLVSAAHLRCGDLEAAHRWFLASRLAEDAVPLGEESSAKTLTYISDLARALAISGWARHLLRLLRRVNEEGGHLPGSVSSVSIAGWTCGRTLATVWMEPPAEVLRRRAIWASDGDKGMTVMSAEQFAWPDLESARHEVYQWSPYLAPDVKLERAWLMPLRMEDVGALGLAREWLGEGPAAAAARERLGEEAPPGHGEVAAAALDRALRLHPPQPRGRVAGGPEEGGLGTPMLPVKRSWRVHHADTVRRCFLTPSRLQAFSKEELVEVLLNDAATRRLVPGARAAQPLQTDMLQLTSIVEKAPETAKTRLRDFMNLTSDALKKKPASELKELLKSLGVSSGGSKTELFNVLRSAHQMLCGKQEVLYVTEEQYEDAILNLSDEQLEKIWQGAKPPGLDPGLLGKELPEAVALELQRERAEDGAFEGSAGDELRLAVAIGGELCQLGAWPTDADLRALCAAAHAAGEPALAAELLRTMADDFQSAYAEEEEEEEEEPPEAMGQGPASAALAEAMASGGWAAESCREFLAGERLLPERAGGEGLGGLLTRYLDPLMGRERGDPERRAEMLEHLREPWEPYKSPEQAAEEAMEGASLAAREGVEACHGAEAKIGIEMAGGVQVLTETDVLRALLPRPLQADALLLELPQSKAAGTKKALRALALPQPHDIGEALKIFSFAQSVWRAASVRKAALAQAEEVGAAGAAPRVDA